MNGTLREPARNQEAISSVHASFLEGGLTGVERWEPELGRQIAGGLPISIDITPVGPRRK
jgi:hypothetical protein